MGDQILTLAAEAYDVARRRAYGNKEGPMSERNRETIEPMVWAAIQAAVPALLSETREGMLHALGRAYPDGGVTEVRKRDAETMLDAALDVLLGAIAERGK